MITYLSGDLFQSPANVLVNTVNTVGVMGKGIALKFKRIYPEMFEAYRDVCERGELQIGKLFLYPTPNKWILNFPTKKHWRNPSRVEYIEAGLSKLRARYSEVGMTSIAFPELGCGNGELDFETQVKPLMERYLGNLSVPTFIYLSGVKTDPPEHKDVRSIKQWLRSEPAALPFDEVWQDIVEVLSRQQEFATLAKGHAYRAIATQSPPTITVEVGDRNTRILSEELLSFWQQLRDFGLTHGSIAPEHRFASYLLPVFAELPYVEPVKVSTSSSGLRSNPAAGLQVVPPPMPAAPEKPATGDLFARPDYAAQG
ncbi:MAG: macro domain-containing protein [Gammaproteobacteria bacterium]|nr:macro domain-containing protein [Gammaproteobacteria bacterium]MYF66524.1 macro domain-containing protein [Gammaproteobacteria bacterium]MYK37164.1 macro domain-containing protein [Gammaproteobacteria bacterium]